MSVKNFLKDYLSFGKRDRLGIILVATLIILIYFLPFFFSSGIRPVQAEQNSFLAKLADSVKSTVVKSENQAEDDFTDQTTSLHFDKPAGELFVFDPNNLDAVGWQRLGLREHNIKTILNYRNKGGRFRRAEDLEKIWGLPAGFYNRVKNYIRIGPVDPVSSPFVTKVNYERKEKKYETVSINEADTTAFIALPGIGSKLAARIVSFRDRLGGFHSLDQVGEVYGLADSVLQKIKPLLVLSGTVKKLNINTATKEELKTHPYLRWNLANAIVEYRNQHGAFKSMEELKNIALIDESLYKKIVPYLMLGE